MALVLFMRMGRPYVALGAAVAGALVWHFELWVEDGWMEG